MAAAGSFPIEVVLKGLDLMSQPLNRVAKSMERVAARSDALKKVGGSLSNTGRNVALTGAAVGAAVGIAANAYMDLEKAQVQAINAFSTSGGLSKHWAAINRQAIEAGDLYPGTSADFIRLAAAMKKTGMDAGDLAAGGFKAAAALQVVLGDVPPEEAGRMFQVMANAMGIAGKDAAFFADQLQRVAYSTPLTIQGAAEAFKYIGAPLKKLRVQGKEDTDLVLATMGSLATTGLSDSQVGTAMGQFMEKLAMAQAKIAGGDTRGAAMKAAFEGLQSAGIDLNFFDAGGQFGGLSNALSQVAKLKNLTDMQKSIVGKALFGQEGQRVITALGGINPIIRKMQEQEAIEKRLGRVTGTLANQWESLQGTFTNFLAAAVEPMKGDLAELAQRINGVLTRTKAWMEANPKLVRWLGLAAVGVSALLVGGGGLLFVGGKLLSLWGGMLTMLPKLALGLRGVALANPWVLALVAGGALLAANWDKVGPIMENVGKAVGGIVDNVAGQLKNQAAILGFATDATGKFDAWGKAAWTLAKAIEIISTGIEAISGVAKIVDPISAATGGLKNNAAGGKVAINTFMSTKGSLWDRIKAANAAGTAAQQEAGGRQVDAMLRPFEGIAQRDPLGVGKKIDAFLGANATIARAFTGGQVSQSVVVNVQDGDPAKVKGAVLDALREQASEAIRILSGRQQVDNRGAYAAQGAR